MLSVLIEGTLIAKPVERTSSKGSMFVTAQVRCNAEDGESVFCSVIAFHASAAEALAALAAGDTVAVAGHASISQWKKNDEHKVGLKVTATRVLTVYEAGQRRKAASAGHNQGQDRREANQERPASLAGRGQHYDARPRPSRPRHGDDDGPV